MTDETRLVDFDGAPEGGEPRIGRFIVHGPIGQGGMGVVLRAADPALGRPVALKILPPAIAGVFDARQRLLAEARAAAVLDHPNICTVYDVGESAAGDAYIAMALYEGETLDVKLGRGPLAPAEAADVAAQVAQGLTHAHAAGIVHCDIKPSNIMVTRGGLVKILDFGIARAVAASQVTTSTTIGTPRYMAPEQLRRVADLDGRTDAWALGIVFFEMLAGVPPFDASDLYTLSHAILEQAPPPLTLPREPGAGGLDAIVRGLLAKDRGARLGLAEFLAMVARPELPVSRPTVGRSLAVLPFENLSADHTDAYFADGLTAEIIADLSRLPSLRVTSRTSTMRFRGAARSAREIARELDVHYLLEGTVRRAGRDLRITAQLVDATSDAELWAAKYSGTMDQIFDIQEQVAKAIADGLRLRLVDAPPEAAARSLAAPTAYDLYLRARNALWGFTPESTRLAIEFVDQALAVAGEQPLLLATRATALWQLINIGAADMTTLLDAERTADHALRLDAAMPAALRVKGLVLAFRGDTDEASRLLDRALDVSPLDPETLSASCLLHALSGRSERGFELGCRATEVDPLYALHWAGRALAAACLGRDAEAAASVRRAFEVNPQDVPTRVIAPLILYGRGDLAPAVEGVDLLVPDAGQAAGYRRFARITAAAIRHDRAAVEALVTPDIEQFLGMSIHNAFYGAEVFALVGETDRSLALLAKAVTLGLGCYPLIARHSHALASVREAPGFPAILSEVERVWRSRQN